MKDHEYRGTGIVGSLFGVPQVPENPDLVIVPVPWDVTASYRDGTSSAPRAVLRASSQLDLSMYMVKKPWKYGMIMAPFPDEIAELAIQCRSASRKVMDQLEKGETPDEKLTASVNDACSEMVGFVEKRGVDILDNNQTCAVLGGDHSCALGLIRALGRYHKFGILQIDAHMDMRRSYQGFEYSHASVMFNALQTPGVTSLVQVGIRDYSADEEKNVGDSDKPVQVFYDDHIKSGLMIGDSWSDWVHSIIAMLPEKVYVSFDIDGLDPALCPNTGTPVPGGLTFDQAVYLLIKLAQSDRTIIGFDLCEVGGKGEWDANVGARILYRLGVYTAVSQGKVRMKL